MASAETARLIASLELQDKNFTRGLKNAERQLGRIDKKLGAASGALNRNLARGIDTVIDKGAELLVGTVKDAAEFESAITGVAKTVDGDISGITDELKKMSTEIPMSFVELAGIAELGGAMGIAKKDLVAFTEQVAILGSTTDVSTEDAATALGVLGNVIGLTGDEFDNFAASLVDLGNKGESTESAILEIAKRSGAAAKLVGIAKDETLAWASAAANLGLNQELAGTALQNLFLKGATNQAGLAKVAGISVKKFKKLWAKDATGALQVFLKQLGKLDQETQIETIQEIFGKGSGLTRLILGLAADQGNLTDSLETGTKAWKEATAAQAEADKRFKTSESLFKRLDNSVKIVSATIGEALLPVLNDLATEAMTALNNPATQKAVKEFAADIGRAARGAAKFITSIDWGSIASSLKTAFGFAKNLVGAFMGMPDWVKTAVITGWGLNKLTGGALTSLLGDTFKIAFQQFAGRGSTPANPLFVADITGGKGGPGGVLPGGGAGGKGLLGLGLKGIGGLALGLTGVGLAAMLASEFEDEIAGLADDLGNGWRNWLKTSFKIDIPTIKIPELEDLQWPFGPKNTPTLLPEIFGGNGILGGTPATTPARGGDRPSPGNPGIVKNALNLKPVTEKQQATNNAIKNAQSVASRENSAQKAELGNVKNAVNTMNATQQASAVAQIAVTTAGNMLSVFQSASQVLAQGSTTTAVNGAAAATRGVAPPITSAVYAIGSQIATAIAVNKPVIQSTNVVNNYTRTQRTGGTSGSRNGGALATHRG